MLLLLRKINKLKQRTMAYNKKFFDDLKEQSLKSAKHVVPIVMDYLKITSVVDYGCGSGSWLRTFQDFGVENIRGYDGNWVNTNDLNIDSSNFFRIDLNQKMSVEEKFDLAVSLEVGEHLKPEAADLLVDVLTSSSNFVLFSAAIPFQGGTYHINEQWPEYWCQKFIERGFYPIDCIRPKIWNNPDVDFWFSQNIILYVKNGISLDNLELELFKNQTNPTFLSRVHPDYYMKIASFHIRLRKIKNKVFLKKM